MSGKKQTKATTKKFSGRTHVGFVLDKSGSMGDPSRRDMAIDGFNEFLEDQKKLKDDTVMSVFLFDTAVITRHVESKLEEISPLTKHDYVPSGCTALWDATAKAIAEMEQHVVEGDRAVIVILTDGEENSSLQVRTAEQMRDIIKMKEKEGNWTFTYMGGGQNWLQDAQRMGVPTNNTVQLDNSNVRASMTAASGALRSYRLSAAVQCSNYYGGSPKPAAASVPHATVSGSSSGNPFSRKVSHSLSVGVGNDPKIDDLLKRSRR